MTDYAMVEVTAELAEELIGNMRSSDVDECWAAGMLTPREAVYRSLEMSPESGALLADGKCLCIFGVGVWTALALRGIPWLLTAKDMPRHARRLLPLSRVFMDEARQRYQFLENYIDARNTKAIRWMRWLGFEQHPAKPFGPHHLPFHHFSWRA